MDRMKSIAAAKGSDVRKLETKARDENDLDTWLALADIYIERGQSSRARVAFRNALSLTPEEVEAMGVDEKAFETIRKNARWTLITRVYQRLMNDHRAARASLDSFSEDYPAFTQTDEYVYADAWTEAHLSHAIQANGVMKNHFVEPGTAEGLLTYLYFAFRFDDEDIWVEAEAIAREKIGDHPEHAAALHAAHGRLLRRLERGNDALAAFEEAVASAGEDDPKRATYVGQLEYLKRNPIRLK
jgi:tetratricopeptide (TPR) repeat protein